jgi:hypothetical protein
MGQCFQRLESWLSFKLRHKVLKVGGELIPVAFNLTFWYLSEASDYSEQVMFFLIARKLQLLLLILS